MEMKCSVHLDIVMPVARHCLRNDGRYIIHQSNHFYNIQVQCDGIACMKVDGENRHVLQTDSINTLIGDPSIRVFRLQPTRQVNSVSNDCLPPWVSSTDVVGGAKASPKTKAPSVMKTASVIKRPSANSHLLVELPVKLQKDIQQEFVHWLKLSADMCQHSEFGSAGSWSCPVCPVRQFAEPKKLRHHINRYHRKKDPDVLSKKMLKVARIQFDVHTLRDKMLETCSLSAPKLQTYALHDAAVTIKNQLHKSPSWASSAKVLEKKGTGVDWFTTTLLDLEDTGYILMKMHTNFIASVQDTHAQPSSSMAS
jgi:hypothetical protein